MGFAEFSEDPFEGIDLGRECIIVDFPEHHTEDEHTIAFASALAERAAHATGGGGDLITSYLKPY